MLIRTISLLLLFVGVALADRVEKTAGAVDQDDTDWSNVVVDTLNQTDDRWSVHANANGIDAITLTNWGFSIPTDATLDTIYLSVEWSGSASQAARRRIDAYMLSPDSTTRTGTSRQNWASHGTADHDSVQTTIGGANVDPLWQFTGITPDTVNATNWGFEITNSSTQAGNIRIDSVSCEIVYTPAAAGGKVVEAKGVTIIQ